MDDEASEDPRGRAYDDGSPRAEFPLVGPGIVDTSRARVSRRVWRERDPVGTVPMTDSPSISNLTSTWDMSVAGVLNGRSTLPAHLDAWLASLRHSYPQASATASLPEPFLGRLDRRPAAVFLVATAGKAYVGSHGRPDFQSLTGVFANEVRELGRYSAWAATWTYFRKPWTSLVSANGIHHRRLQFLRHWHGDDRLDPEDMVTLCVVSVAHERSDYPAPFRPRPAVDLRLRAHRGTWFSTRLHVRTTLVRHPAYTRLLLGIAGRHGKRKSTSAQQDQGSRIVQRSGWAADRRREAPGKSLSTTHRGRHADAKSVGEHRDTSSIAREDARQTEVPRCRRDHRVLRATQNPGEVSRHTTLAAISSTARMASSFE